MLYKNTRRILFLIVYCLFTHSCRKDLDNVQQPENTEQKQVLDSIFLYAKQIYYWSDRLPKQADFNTSKYTGGNDIATYNKEIFDIAGYAINPETGKSYEFYQSSPAETKFSIILDKKGNSVQTDYKLTDIGNNYGITMVALGNIAIYIEYVIKNSPAEKAGIRRGMKVEEINGRKGENTADFYKYIKNAFDFDKVELTLNGKSNAYQSQKFSLKRSAYISDPVNKVAILKVNNTNVGYISYLKFFSPRGQDESLNNAFAYFNSNAVKELIIDLRYNGGGDVTTCENFANIIAPQSINGKIMRKEKYNSLMQSGGANLLAKQPILNDDGTPALIINGRVATFADGDYSLEGNTSFFKKSSGLNNLTRVYFIVSKKTASASELLINCLKPYMDVKLIGVRTSETLIEPIKTFGKPIGFFPVIIKSYPLYLSLFQNLNANNEGDYFDGMPTTITTDDDVETDFGELEEKGLYTALNDMGYIQKRISANNKLSKTKSGTTNNVYAPKTEVFGKTEYQRIIKSNIKLK
ncbi:S41 family peptidase [Pedobacter sp. 22226]|uniref:S41 family peptidase n=1 Tax=Pedobacter sp. 22226 TaxID=3453894 RepID=UPI003F84401E